MSMFVNVVRVKPATFELIKKDPAVFEGVLDGDAAVMAKLGIEEGDSQGFDYQSADDMMEAMDNLEDDEEDEKPKKKKKTGDDDEEEEEEDDDEEDDDEEEDDAVFKALFADGSLDYDGGFGPARTLSPAAVKKAAKQSSVLELDDDVKKLFKAAAKRGDYVIAIIT
jgi:hypothetical protein